MPRPRVLSFMSEWGGGSPHRRTASSTATEQQSPVTMSPQKQIPAQSGTYFAPSSSATQLNTFDTSSPSPTHRNRSDSRPSSRPISMIQTYQPPVMEVSSDTLPELQRIFTFLNSHSNKLYQEGYFLKFHDTDSRGRPAPDRVWQECFAQLVGTILSLWDASELDTIGKDDDVLPTFINLTDAAVTMMPSMTLNDGKKLDNILSVSTAASNKYLFHFNSFNSLTQWTAGIRLAMYEHTTLQEAYTGALIAGKGKSLNNIRHILNPTKFKHEDWARVRFGAGTPWRRCWCVITPPDEKEYAKLQKTQKKQTIYNRSPPVLKGDMKFYDTKKITKKTRPIATVTEAYAAYAIYPQSKPLIDQSTLVKIEGRITIHSKPESTSEGFVFVMPETHPAVSGFEIMLRFLFPVFDVFALYGRPKTLIADSLDTRGLMFAMPSDRRYGYLEMWDVVGLIHTEGSQNWSERQWRKQLKDLTAKRMSTPSRDPSRTGSRRATVSRTSLPPSRSGTLRFEEAGSIRSHPSSRRSSPTRAENLEIQGPRRVDSAPPAGPFATPRHQRSVSEAHGYKQYQAETPSQLAYRSRTEDDFDTPPPPPEHRIFHSDSTPTRHAEGYETDGDDRGSPEIENLPDLHNNALPVGPVASPPTFTHAPGQKPPVQVHQPLMKPHAQMDPATLDQLADATNATLPAGVAAAGAAAAWRSQQGRRSGEYDRHEQRGYDQYQHQSMSGSRSGQSNRLPTIPASPYIEQPEFVSSPATYQPTAPPVPEHAEMPQSQYSVGEGSLDEEERPSSGGSQVHRKPVPGRSPLTSREVLDNQSTKSSSLGSLRYDVIHPEDLDRLNRPDPTLARHPSYSSSRYSDDAASTSTPDYASTISEESRTRRLPPREERPRSGVLKVVGNPALNPKSKPDLVIGEAHYKEEAKKEEIQADIPTIDFGPTYVLRPDEKRPGTSGTMTQALHDGESRSKENLGLYLNSASRSKENLGQFTQDQKLRPYSPAGIMPTTPGTPGTPGHFRSSSASPSLALGLDNRQVAWQPGMVAAPHSERKKIDAEEWVQQRAAVHSRTPPLLGHSRSQSHTPPLNHQKSGDWTNLQRTPEGMPSRPPSRPLSRPQSRGASTLLMNDRPTQLSAREQEQISRMTGTPLINLTRNQKDTQRPSSAGLVGYVENREQERAAAKANRNTAAMQAEIDRRMMAAQQRQMMEMQRMSMGTPVGYPSPVMTGTPLGYPQAFAFSSPNQFYQQQSYFPPQPQATTPTWGIPPGGMMQPQYGAAGFVQQQPVRQHTPTHAYGASFDQAQAAARFAQQNAQQQQNQFRRK